jgi:hypothetical protein
MRALWVAAIAVLAAACASTPVPSSNAIPVPEHRILVPEIAKPQEGHAYVVVTRDEGFLGEACAVALYVDGAHVADLRKSEQIRLFVKPGKHLLGVDAKGCYRGSDQTSIDASQDKLTLLRIEVQLREGFRIKPSAF